MDNKTAIKPDLYLFEKFDVGIIHLDAHRNVVALNDYARRVLPVDDKKPFGKLVTSFHPDRSVPKVKFLLDEASGCPMANAVPMTMIINIPEQVLLIKVSRLGDEKGHTTGFALVFYDVTQVVGQDRGPVEPPSSKVRLSRIPLVTNHKVSFVETSEVLSIESLSHYTRVQTKEGYQFCNLSIGDLASRLDPDQFMRVHRCFIVNLKAVQAIGREGSKTHLVLKGKNNQPVPVSRGEAARLREVLGLN
jgi:hypothetical protein